MLSPKLLWVAALSALQFPSVRAGSASFQFGEYGPSVLFFNVQNNVTSFVCLNLDEIFSNQHAVTNTSTNSTERADDSPVFILKGVEYTRPRELNGGNSSGYNYDASAVYNWWNLAQGFSGLATDPSLPDSGISAAMQMTVYGEANCENQMHPSIAYSCQNEYGVPGGAAWGAKSMSLQPHDVDAADCLYNATTGVENSGAPLTRNLWSATRATWVFSAVRMAFAVGL